MSGRRWAGILVMTLVLVTSTVFAVSELLAGSFPRHAVGAIVASAIGLVLFCRPRDEPER
ncbi:hypothetical protein CSIV_11120 [Microbacterium sp. CSI-V]|uniref:hypothetical protein n=1 Tax=unclassified Microbacterium TaxID=2609290 RepID=UPI00097BD4B6|nr:MULTISPECIES: hypothetical protein [unclassified Microbacterium]MXS73425.1 hypothetical protein [Microbacterium sp. TL13]ONI62085.1 hypothetical protein CSIV_11120 [Microbacterium sp. CSI-V]